MDFNEVLIFATVAKALSVTGAANALGLPKSTVSRKIAQLEERLGARLIQRTTRALQLTEIGAAYYQHCAHIVDEVNAAERAVAAMQSSPAGTVRLAVPTAIGNALLGGLVADYLVRQPGTRVALTLTDAAVDPIDGGFDLVLRFGPLSESSLIARKLGISRRLLCASPSYLERRGTPHSPLDLEQHDCLVSASERGPVVWRLKSGSGPLGVTVTGPLLVNDDGIAHAAAVAGRGIARLPEYRCADDLRSGRLRSVLDDAMGDSATLYALYPSQRHLAATVKTFLDFLSERMAQLLGSATVVS
jgi:DNA-binding transcriptional LysR family regulator